MTHPGYSYLDITVLPEIRDLVVDQRGAVLFSADFKRVYWLNSGGASLLGADLVREVLEQRFDKPDTMLRQIVAMSSRSDERGVASGTLRVRAGWKSQLMPVSLQMIDMPDGEKGHLLVSGVTSRKAADIATLAKSAVDCLDGYGAASAVIDASGMVLAGSKHFEPLQLDKSEVASLVDEVATENDRLVKRLVETKTTRYAAGIARLQDQPALHLLILAETSEADGETSSEAAATIIDDTDAAEKDDLAETNANIDDESNPVEVEEETATEMKSPFAGAFSSKRPSLKGGDRGVNRWYYRQPKPTPAPEAQLDNNPKDELPGKPADQTAVQDNSDQPSGSETPDTLKAGETAENPADETLATEHEVDGRTSVSPVMEKIETEANVPANRLEAKDEPLKNTDTGNSEDTGQETGAPGSEAEFQFAAKSKPLRFAWEMDGDLVFKSISDDFVQTVGPNAADIIGRTWADVARVFDLDEDGDIEAVLNKRDTWSGKTVLWPVQATDLRVPVDLAGLPAFDRERNFTGFNGFGIVRTADTIVDEEELGLTLAAPGSGPDDSPSKDDADEASTPETVPMFRQRNLDKPLNAPNIVNLGERREANKSRELSVDEKQAFEAIGDKLNEGPAEDKLDSSTSKNPENSVKPVKMPASEPFGRSHEKTNISALLGKDEDDTGLGEITKPPMDSPFKIEPLDAETAKDQQAPQSSETSDLFDEPDSTNVEPDDQTPVFVPSAFSTGGQPPSPRPVDTTILSGLPIPVLIYRDQAVLFGNDAFWDLSGFADVADLDNSGGIETLLGSSEDDDRTAITGKDGNSLAVNVHMQSVPWDENKALLLAFRESTETKSSPSGSVERPDNLATLATIAKSPNTATSFANISAEDIGSILDTATDGVLVVSPDGVLQAVNRSAEALFGYEAKNLIGEHFTTLLAQESHRSARDYLSGLSGTGVASVLNDGREVIGKESHGGLIPLFLTMGRLSGSDGYCVVMRDITQWKKAEEDLVSARHQAELASEQKTEFLAKVSHEIRTPLNAIIGFSDLMLEERFGRIDNDRYREYLRDINRSGSHVLELINDLLDISKIEAGKLELDFEEVMLNEIISETVALSQPQANNNRIIIRTSLSGSVPKVVADPRSIRQIVLNLVTNAIKYTGAGGQVIVSTVYEDNGKVAIRVRDTGIGMSDSEIVTALKPFRQINTLSKQRGEGTGLGLPLTKALVEANRAQFSIQSTPGEGTLVEIFFPSTRVLAD